MNNIKLITKAFTINRLILKIKTYEIYNLKINKINRINTINRINKMIIKNLNKMIY